MEEKKNILTYAGLQRLEEELHDLKEMCIRDRVSNPTSPPNNRNSTLVFLGKI